MAAKTQPDADAVFDVITLALAGHTRNMAQTVCRCTKWREGQQDPSRGVDGVAATVTWSEHLANVAAAAIDEAGWVLVPKDHPLAITSEQKAVDDVVHLVERYGQIDGNHHRQWVLDQVMRLLLGEGYQNWVNEYAATSRSSGHEEWDEGIAP